MISKWRLVEGFLAFGLVAIAGKNGAEGAHAWLLAQATLGSILIFDLASAASRWDSVNPLWKVLRKIKNPPAGPPATEGRV